MSKYVKFIIPVAIVGAGILLMSFLSGFGEEPPKTKPPVKAKSVEAMIVQPGSNSADVTVYGRLNSSQPVILTAEVEGTLKKGDVLFRPAQKFSKGDLLIKIDDSQATLDVKSAKSDFLNSLAQVLPEIKIDFPDNYDLWQNYFNSISFDETLPEMPKAKNQKIKLYLTRYSIYKLYFSVKNLEIRHSKHYFYAPFDGAVISADVREGSVARPGTRLGQIINLSSMEIELPVQAVDLNWLDKSGEVVLSSDAISEKLSGKIVRIASAIDENTQTVPVYVSPLKRVGAAYNGLFFKAVLPGKIVENSVRVPRKSVYKGEYVYTIRNAQLSLEKLEIVRGEPDYLIVKDSFNAGDTLVTEILQGVSPGMPATPRFVASGAEGK